jgi:hypothetical protein
MPSPIELASRTISFRSDLQVMVVRWHSHTSVAVVQADYAHMLAVAEANNLTNWLLDVRRRDKTPAELSAWVSDVFYPEAVARVAPRRLRMAVLSSPALTEAYRTDEEQKQFVAYNLDPARPYDIGLFEDEGKAMHWLSPLLR